MDVQSHTDQMHREIWLPAYPRRIVSLVPSQTEFLCAIGLGDRLVGRTLFCIHPEQQLKSVPHVGGTKKLHLDQIRALQPDLVIGNKEENDQKQIEELSATLPVWMSDIVHPGDALNMMRDLGIIMQLEENAGNLIAKVEKAMGRAREKQDRFKGIGVLYAIWKDPWMFAGKQTFIDAMLSLAGFTNLCEKDRYPELSLDEIKKYTHPKLILLSSEPFPFKIRHCMELQDELKNTRAMLVDGEMFSWYGSRMTEFPEYLDILFTQLHKKTL